ncbi:hypothetical protein SAMN05443667_11334 [Flavobacterium gillisiae]|uniref:Uncharacterized protein n=1 Tax=Flavobacterium gillisiae TaxID=150146 RepID=A0A1H4FDR3_9FLAO|nr:hypothetical protein [Flavobacterium gillisiae]SEA95426.1 hypothetical protein SAMN05443667_11334 [Flavobacterium gillisiae]
MKREYFGMLFIIVSVSFIFAFDYIFGEQIVQEYISKFIVIWILIAFFVGQYSMRFPKSI